MRWTSLALALVASASVHAANIDEGFTQDGKTTYCEGVRGGDSAGAMSFPELYPHSVNRCPVVITMTASAVSVHAKDPIDVTWKAAGVKGEIPGNIFPNALDKTTKVPQNVLTSLMKACKAGTNCATLIDPTPTGPATAESGAFSAQGSKDLRANRFIFPDVGDYVLVGKIVLPGDATLNVSATEFIAFQKVSVVDPSVSLAPTTTPPATTTPAPTTATPASTTKGENENMSTPNTSKDSKGSENTTTRSEEEDDGFFATHGTLLIGVVAACLVVAVAGYVVVQRRKKAQQAAYMKRMGGPPMFAIGSSDGPDAGAYQHNKSGRHSITLPMMGRPSTSYTEEIPNDLSRRGSELDESFEEGTVDASNSVMASIESQEPAPLRKFSAQPYPPPHHQQQQQQQQDKYPQDSLYSDIRDSSMIQEESMSIRSDTSDMDRDYFQSEAWDATASAAPGHIREESTVNFDDEFETGRGYSMDSYSSEGVFDTARPGGRQSDASVDSYAFRPSSASVAESYKSRVSRYSGISDFNDSEIDSTRSSGISIFSARDTNARHI
ncbi:hypothetical protein Poli38472_002202 [Pythium oligandrum]|uniref:Uncharacterized protein n=1 Tax=Pythium oligandrum TaxID=41045 RepID=A0A8K1CGT1_PYTOL|nr:hypothetical protein Poli38472_002202 [Pythium oligandrum]|eukprot:TMW63261.1 hypothetical protein Poli38472_002202 [Pythium oligandrum]